MPNLNKEAQVRQSWERAFTDPNHHSPINYRYLIHTVADDHIRELFQFALYCQGQYNPAYFLDLTKDPQKIAERKLLACSVIDQDHPWLFRASSGYILKSPFENILGAFPGDIGSITDVEPGTFRMKHGTLDTSVEELALKTPHRGYNEVVLTGATSQGVIEITGVYRIISEDLDVYQKRVLEKLITNAERLGLPVVNLPYAGPVIPVMLNTPSPRSTNI